MTWREELLSRRTLHLLDDTRWLRSGDSGATRTLLTPRAARLFERKLFHPQDTPLEVVYGGRERAPVISKVQIGE